MSVITKLYHNTTDEPILVPQLSDTPIEPHDHISVTSQYHQPVVLENYPGVVEVSDLSPEEQTAFYAEHKANIDKAAAPRAAKLRARDNAANAAEAKAKGWPTPDPLPEPEATEEPAEAEEATE